MPSLTHATTPVHLFDAEGKANHHDQQVRRIEALLKSALPDERRQSLQADLLRHARTAHLLRNPVPGNPKSQMRSYVRLDKYFFNG